MRKYCKKMVSGYNTVATKTTQRIIETLDCFRLLPFGSSSKSFQTTPRLLCKFKTINENGKYGKLQRMDWNDIWHVPFFV